jgi:hypothetical protein
MTTSRLYYEAHITIDPILDTELSMVSIIASRHGFRVAKLLMARPERSEHREDAFMTARHQELSQIMRQTLGCFRELEQHGHRVRRWKIEDTILDSREGDTLEMLGS